MEGFDFLLAESETPINSYPSTPQSLSDCETSSTSDYSEISIPISSSTEDEYERELNICRKCLQQLTGEYYCHPCYSARLKDNFANWTSCHEAIDEFIREAQLNATHRDELLEWIPHDQLDEIKYLARGGFGTVYSAIWKDGPINYWDDKQEKWLRREMYKVALKNIRSDTSDFVRELKTQYLCSTRTSTESRVIWFLGITQDPTTKSYLLVMPYAKYGDLRHFLRKNFPTCTWTQRITMLYYIAQGLNDIHSAGLIHRDFHTGNILQLSNSYSYIGDLGLSIRVDGVQEKQQVFGVIPYIAPEVFRGQGYSKASDVYSFSMVMWEIATGRPPFARVAHDEYLVFAICDGKRPEKLWKWRTAIDKNLPPIATEIRNSEEYRLSNFGKMQNNGQPLHSEAIYRSRRLVLSDSDDGETRACMKVAIEHHEDESDQSTPRLPVDHLDSCVIGWDEKITPTNDRYRDSPVPELSPTSTLCYSTTSLHTGVSPLLASVDLNSEDPNKKVQNEIAMHTGLTSRISGLKFIHEKRRSEVLNFEGKYFMRMLYCPLALKTMNDNLSN
ncbi:784_t:CDS:2 [Paraglomus occultum]|uniref:784_t:CDS:1 n=1 Tax=Paraglomus occultum TaxID=144539 RepID=A0A9N9C7Q0_9GLOM|nr:784_t:CDS:2 [Paraglomus occultum]